MHLRRGTIELGLLLVACSVVESSSNEQGVLSSHAEWRLEDHLGNLSPWKKAPVPAGIEQELPRDCVVDQIMLVSTTRISMFYVSWH